ncbi:hypothetical protein L596_016153 [Steinernema carpocapsae]|uniref:Uncharacterized protein n=1 Tax=Steinernema carpocapsae TaxID=34508 RepID=A0A4V6A3B1_STECR|nr:hypothetical protein L596_016153 [Steinernema carpocapsae]
MVEDSLCSTRLAIYKWGSVACWAIIVGALVTVLAYIGFYKDQFAFYFSGKKKLPKSATAPTSEAEQRKTKTAEKPSSAGASTMGPPPSMAGATPSKIAATPSQAGATPSMVRA